MYPRLSLFIALCCGLISSLQAQEKPLYKKASLPIDERVADLLQRMTMEEKIAQLSHLHGFQIYNEQQVDLEKLKEAAGDRSYGCVEGFTLTSANCAQAFYEIQQYMVEQTRLGIPIITVSESLHGSVHDGSTIFPQSVALGSTFNTDLAYRMTHAIADELKAQGVIQTLSPGLDVVRELRWGRVEESFGEDPWLVGQMGIAQVKGYIDNGVAPMLKPYGPGGAPLGGLNLASVESGERDVRNIHIKPYEMVVKNTDVKAVMTSYNSWNNIPNSASKYLLTDILRKEWGFKGYVYSDWGAVEMLKSFHLTAKDNAEAAKQSLMAGMDLEASSNCFQELATLIEKNELDIQYVDQAVSRVLRVKFELGLFEDPYANMATSQELVHRTEAQTLSREIADESIVLLKNENNLLPLSMENIESVAVIGPNANQVQFGDYTWSRDNQHGVTPLKGIQDLLDGQAKINYATGCDLISNDTSGFEQAIRAAQISDVSILFVGSSSASLARDYANATSGEGFDLSSLQLTGVQEELVKAVYAQGKPTIVVLVTGRPFAIPWIKKHVPAIAIQWYGGERAGDAIADMLFGKTNPSAKTPFSFPQSVGHLPVYYNHLPTDKGFYHKPGKPGEPGRDYVFSDPEPLWPFGYGLSYTAFQYQDVKLSAETLLPTDTLSVWVKISNIGKMDGKEVVQLYVRDLVSSVVTPVKQLKAFAKYAIASGDTTTIKLQVPIDELALYDLDMNRIVESGEYEIQIGSSSKDIYIKKTIAVNNTVEANNQQTPSIYEKTPQQPEKAGEIITVTGEIRDVQATPIARVNITALQSGEVTHSDSQGKYTIKAAENDVLLFSADGFKETSIQVNGKKQINARMNYHHQ
ncbi:glycoside hydrolase family 3 C-terminal domain-containing protein [Olivibacter sp. SDN3]|nr:glycoside hydrolase family 3 C-terminal domain-containing protein [Olivibacter sp. SDN3]